jgi:S1-C subfamily serine protease
MRLVILSALALSCVSVPSPVVGLQDATGRVTCSAFSVEGGHLVTAAHCVHGERARYVTRQIWETTTDLSRVAKVTAVDAAQDWAVLTPPNQDGLVSLRIGKVARGDLVTVIATLNDWRPATGRVVESFFAGLTVDGPDHLRWESTVTVEPGWSGAPVINARGEAVGMFVEPPGI